MNFPPACLFPTTTVFLDDEDDFLAHLRMRLELPGHKLRCFSRTDQAKQFLLEQASQCWKADWISSGPSECNFENIALEIEIPKIASTFYSGRGFDKVTTLVVDYKMPRCNGLQFIESLADIPLKKVLLTNVASAEIAVDAMANNLIDAYVKKHDPNLIGKLREIMLANQLDFFRDKSSFIKHSLTIFMQDNEEAKTAYCDLVRNIHRDHEATGYYLTDQNGSYAFFNDAGDKINLIIKTKEQLEAEFDDLREKTNAKQILKKLEKFEATFSPRGSSNIGLDLFPLGKNQTFFYALDRASCDMEVNRPYA